MATRRTFAEKLTALITTVGGHDGIPRSYREMSAAIKGADGSHMSSAYIQQLATGRRINPKIHYVEALARVFRVPVGYFFDEEVADQVDAQLAEVEAGRRRDAAASSEEAKVMAMRAEGLSPEGRRQVMDLLELVERYERGAGR